MTRASAHQEHVDHAVHHLRQLSEHNQASLDSAARAVFDTVRGAGLVHAGGAGHSLGAVLETFYRAGGLAAVRPMHHAELLPLCGASSSSRAERRSGLAKEVLAGSGFRPGVDVLVVFSNSGVNPYPVELAERARTAGAMVIAVTSRSAGAAAPRRSTGVLTEHADILLDTLVPDGDVSHPPDAPVTAPLSTLANALLWNLLLTRVYEMAVDEQVPLPLWASANTTGGDEVNAAHLRHYTEQVPELG